jgi:hypothetical protein
MCTMLDRPVGSTIASFIPDVNIIWKYSLCVASKALCACISYNSTMKSDGVVMSIYRQYVSHVSDDDDGCHENVAVQASRRPCVCVSARVCTTK